MSKPLYEFHPLRGKVRKRLAPKAEPTPKVTTTTPRKRYRAKAS